MDSKLLVAAISKSSDLSIAKEAGEDEEAKVVEVEVVEAQLGCVAKAK